MSDCDGYKPLVKRSSSGEHREHQSGRENNGGLRILVGGWLGS